MEITVIVQEPCDFKIYNHTILFPKTIFARNWSNYFLAIHIVHWIIFEQATHLNINFMFLKAQPEHGV